MMTASSSSTGEEDDDRRRHVPPPPRPQALTPSSSPTHKVVVKGNHHPSKGVDKSPGHHHGGGRGGVLPHQLRDTAGGSPISTTSPGTPDTEASESEVEVAGRGGGGVTMASARHSRDDDAGSRRRLQHPNTSSSSMASLGSINANAFGSFNGYNNGNNDGNTSSSPNNSGENWAVDWSGMTSAVNVNYDAFHETVVNPTRAAVRGFFYTTTEQQHPHQQDGGGGPPVLDVHAGAGGDDGEGGGGGGDDDEYGGGSGGSRSPGRPPPLSTSSDRCISMTDDEIKIVEKFWKTYDDVIVLSLGAIAGILARLGAAKFFTYVGGAVFREDSALFTNLPLNCLSCFLMGLFCSGEDALKVVYTRGNKLNHPALSPTPDEEEDEMVSEVEEESSGLRRRRIKRSRRRRSRRRRRRNGGVRSYYTEDEYREVQLEALERRIRASPSLVLFPAPKEQEDLMEHADNLRFFGGGDHNHDDDDDDAALGVDGREGEGGGWDEWVGRRVDDGVHDGGDENSGVSRTGRGSLGGSLTSPRSLPSPSHGDDDEEGDASQSTTIARASSWPLHGKKESNGTAAGGHRPPAADSSADTGQSERREEEEGRGEWEERGDDDDDATPPARQQEHPAAQDAPPSSSPSRSPPTVRNRYARRRLQQHQHKRRHHSILAQSDDEGEIDGHVRRGRQDISDPEMATGVCAADASDDTGIGGEPPHMATDANAVENDGATAATTSPEADPFHMRYLTRLRIAERWDVGTTAEAMCDDILLGLRVGFCGALSTFSSWNSSMVDLLRSGQIGQAIVGYFIGLELPIIAYRTGQHLAVYIFVWRCRRETAKDERRGYGLRLGDADDESVNDGAATPGGRILAENATEREVPSVRAILTAVFILVLVFLFTSLHVFPSPSQQLFAISLLFSPFGVLARWRISKFNSLRPNFPLGTFTCNMLGCLLSGSLGQFLAGNPGPEERVVLVGIISGFAGSLSTLATFLVEVLDGIDPIILKFDGITYAIVTIFWGIIVGLVSFQTKDWADEIEHDL